MRPFFVYMLRCADGSFYVGHTDDLERRLAERDAGEVRGYTQSRRPVERVWSAEFPKRSDALERERQIKGWSRAKKSSLIVGDWDAIHRHAASRERPSIVRQASRDEFSLASGEHPGHSRSAKGVMSLECATLRRPQDLRR